MAKLCSPKHYYTRISDRRMAKLGDALLATTQSMGGGITFSQLITEGPVSKGMLWFALIIMLIGGVGKFLTSFYKEEG
jgi:hypothetical protein